jgi:beta-1,4-mannosyltransferase
MAMRILFAPDYRAGTPYQDHLAQALREFGTEVEFLSNYSRGLPLFRGVSQRRNRPDALHLHWPEAYFKKSRPWETRLRVWRFRLDLGLLAARIPIFLTAHNLLPHNRGEETGVFANIRFCARRARKIFVHSLYARDVICGTFGVPSGRCQVIPCGDHTTGMLPPLPRELARSQLGLPPSDREKVCLVFGTASPYKGTDEVVRFWVERRIPHRLVIVGPVTSETFATQLRQLAQGAAAIDLRLSRQWLTEGELRCWLSAADCSIFNYREIFTSGAAAQARSFGLPILIPTRLQAADLGEPHPHVFRFDRLEGDFLALLERALATAPDSNLAAAWRDATSWRSVARLTQQAYDAVLAPSPA